MITHRAQGAMPRGALGAEEEDNGKIPKGRLLGQGDTVLTLSLTPPSHHFHFFQQSCLA